MTLARKGRAGRDRPEVELQTVPRKPTFTDKDGNHGQHDLTPPPGHPVSGPASAEDPRVTSAREYLQHVRTGPKPAALPRAAVDREAAELRKLLGQVLEVVRGLLFTIADAEDEDRERDATHVDVEGGAWFTPADALTVAGALADAARWQVQHGTGERAERYRLLARVLEDGR